MVARLSLYPGGEPLDILDVSDHQEALWTIVGGVRGDFLLRPAVALLMPGPNGRNDPGAIHVLIGGVRVGRLSDEDAADYRPGLLRLMRTSSNGLVALECEIVHRRSRSGGAGPLEVALRHNPWDFGIEPRATRAETGELRVDAQKS